MRKVVNIYTDTGQAAYRTCCPLLTTISHLCSGPLSTHLCSGPLSTSEDHCDAKAAFLYSTPAGNRFTGGSMVSALGLILGITLSVMLITILSYILIKWYKRGQCFERPNFAANLEKLRQMKSTQLEFAPPFTVSGSMNGAGSATYTRFHEPNV